MATTTKYLRGSEQSIMTTELNSLANNVAVVSPVVTVSDTGYILADVSLNVTFGTNPTASTGAAIWFLRETDGSNYETSGNGVNLFPARFPDLVMPFIVSTAAQLSIKQVVLPPGPFRCLLKNDGSGQTFAASANTLKFKAYTYQGV
jgi:hypothetical protein